MDTSGPGSLKEEGLRLIKEGEYQKALSVLDKLVEIDPSDPQAFLYLGVAYFEMGNKAEAIAAFEQSVSNKITPRGCYNLGLAYEAVERLGEAMTQFENAVRMDNSYKAALEAIERLKQQGIQPKESTVQWTIGARSVGEEIAAKKAQEEAELQEFMQLQQSLQANQAPEQNPTDKAAKQGNGILGKWLHKKGG